MASVFAIPDTHFPWVDKDALAWIYTEIERRKPTHIIQLGDLQDQFAQSRFARTHNLMTPAMETIEGREGAENMWRHIRRIAPKSELHQILGNHDDRAEKRLLDKCPELAHLLEEKMQDIYKFKGVTTHFDSSIPLEIDGVLYIHGYLTKLGDHCKHFLQPVVHGHTHRAGVFYTKQSGGLLWELDCGHLGDESAVPMRYTPTRRNVWVKGYGWIENQNPFFVAYPGK